MLTEQKKLSEEGVRKMAQLLSGGATMLSKSCPKCGAPLFRTKDGKVICASCGFTPEGEVTGKPAEVKETKAARITRDELNGILNEKLPFLVAELRKAKDPGKIRDLVSSIEKILGLLEEK